MSEQEQRPGFVESVGNLATSPVGGEALSELRAAGDRAEAKNQIAPWFGDQEVGDEMAHLGQSGPVKAATDIMSPFALAGGMHDLSDDMEHGRWGKALTVDTSDVVGGSLGSVTAAGDAMSWLGNTSLLSGRALGSGLSKAGTALTDAAGMGPLGWAGAGAGVVASAKAGWDTGNEFNAITRESGRFGQNSDGSNRSFSEKAGEDGFEVRRDSTDWLQRHHLGAVANGLGNVAGGATVLGESLIGTAAAAPIVVGKEICDVGNAVEKWGAGVGDKVADDGAAVHDSVAHFLGGDNYGGLASGVGHAAAGVAMVGDTVGRATADIASGIGHGVVDAGKSAVSGVEQAGSWVGDHASRAWHWLAG
jgi:hypothetical protein